MNTLVKKNIKSNFLSLIMRNVITGKEFNKKYNDTKLYKIVKDNFIHNNFKYKHGLNIDILPFNPTGECLYGGLYFTELNKLILWFSQGSYICKVIIPDDASVNIEKNKFKTNKLILDLDNRILIKDFYIWNDYIFSILAVQENIKIVLENSKKIKELKEEIYQNNVAFEYLKQHTEKIYKLIFLQNYYYKIENLKKETKEECILAIITYYYTLKYVKHKKDYLNSEFIEQKNQSYNNLKFLKKQMSKICKLTNDQTNILQNKN